MPPIIRSRLSSDQPSATLPALRVRYYRRMKPNKVYPVQIGWKGTRKGSTDGGSVQVRLIMAGAQVVPSEQPLDPGDPQARVTFYVTPLAKGWLRGERAEVIQNGRKIGELRTPAKVTTQRKTLCLLLLTFLMPWLLGQAFGNELSEETMVKGEKRQQKAGTVLERHIRDFVPEILPPVQEHAKDYTHYLTDIPTLVSSYYTYAFYTYKSYHVPYYAFWIMVLLTLLSYFWHREKRKTSVGQPIEVES